MPPLAIVIIVLMVIIAAVILVMRRRPRQDAGMQTFRRHIDALSPEARKEVSDRARKHQEGRN